MPGLLARHRCHPEEEGTHLERLGRVVSGTVVYHFVQEPGVKLLVEHLPSMCKALGSIPITERKKNSVIFKTWNSAVL